MKHLVKKVIAHLESQKTNLIDLGRDFQLSNAQIAQVVGKGAQGYYDMLSELYESNIDYFYSANIESIMHILDGFLTDAEKNEVGDLRDFIYENDLHHYYRTDIDDETLLQTEVHCTLTLQSNYDCINSFFFETSGGQISVNETYLGDVLKLLGISHSEFKKHIQQNTSLRSAGKFSKTKHTPKVDIEAFYTELQNSCTPASQFAFAVVLTLGDFVSEKPKKSVRIEKGTKCGFFSSWQGGASPFDLEVQEAFILNLQKPFGKQRCPYTNIAINVEGNRGGYGLFEIGFDSSVFSEASLV